MKIGLFGHGKMGSAIQIAAHKFNYSIVALEHADVYIDFSHSEVVLDNIKQAVCFQKPIIIGTTGWESQLSLAKEMIENSKTAALFAPNFSIGMALFIKILKQARSLLAQYDLAGVEFHHNQKKDAPSGTAKKIAQELEMANPFTSVRCGNLAGKHTVIFDSPCDSITFTHEAHNRDGFAQGAVKAAEWILNKKGWYTLDDMLRSLYSAHYSL